MSEDRKKELLAQFAGNEELKEAVKDIILASIYENGVQKEGVKHQPMRNVFLSLFLNTDDRVDMAELGMKGMAIAEGMRLLENAFDKIDDYKVKVNKSDEEKPNPGR